MEFKTFKSVRIRTNNTGHDEKLVIFNRLMDGYWIETRHNTNRTCIYVQYMRKKEVVCCRVTTVQNQRFQFFDFWSFSKDSRLLEKESEILGVSPPRTKSLSITLRIINFRWLLRFQVLRDDRTSNGFFFIIF